jgi:hypothetical protein
VKELLCLKEMIDTIKSCAKWANDNQGVVTVVIFAATILLGWVSGIFGALRHKPVFKISILDGPTFCSTFPIAEKYKGYDVHRTAIAVYLNIANIGSAPASIERIFLGYKWHLDRFSILWLRYRLFWFWLNYSVTSLEDFKYDFGQHIKVYPFLLQVTSTVMKEPQAYLQVGQSVNGVVYFEQKESWGGCFPSPKNGTTKVKLKIKDSFGGSHTKKTTIPVVLIEEARKYCGSFGMTFETLKTSQSKKSET